MNCEPACSRGTSSRASATETVPAKSLGDVLLTGLFLLALLACSLDFSYWLP